MRVSKLHNIYIWVNYLFKWVKLSEVGMGDNGLKKCILNKVNTHAKLCEHLFKAKTDLLSHCTALTKPVPGSRLRTPSAMLLHIVAHKNMSTIIVIITGRLIFIVGRNITGISQIISYSPSLQFNSSLF